MPDTGHDTRRVIRAAGQGRWLAAAVALLLSGPLAAEGVPNQDSLDLQDRLATLQDLVRDPANDALPLATLLQAVGLPAPGPLPAIGQPFDHPHAARAASIDTLDTRLALTPLLQSFGAEGATGVLVAQTDPAGRAIVIRDGDATLDMLRAHLGAPDAPLRLTRPLVILEGASLRLGPGDRLDLSRADGAFILNYGHLELRGATIAGTPDENHASRVFRPFVTTVNTGTIDLQGAHLADLGFGRTEKFSGLSILRTILHDPARPSRIEETRFDRLASVRIVGDTAPILRANRFADMTNAAIIVQRSPDARILSNAFWGDVPTNAIRIEDDAQAATVAGNVIMGGDRAGIVVREDARHATVADNIVWNRDGSGITLTDADCSTLSGNLVIANDQKGIEVRSSLSVLVTRNTALSNHSAGIWVSDQQGSAQIMLADNRVAYNGAGLAGANSAHILMAGNDFSRQYQQFLAGDLALLTPTVARNMQGAAPFVLASGAPFDRAAPLPPCEG
jgi:poly(beta-D-mannuronate) C5 epimerase